MISTSAELLCSRLGLSSKWSRHRKLRGLLEPQNQTMPLRKQEEISFPEDLAFEVSKRCLEGGFFWGVKRIRLALTSSRDLKGRSSLVVKLPQALKSSGVRTANEKRTFEDKTPNFRSRGKIRRHLISRLPNINMHYSAELYTCETFLTASMQSVVPVFRKSLVQWSSAWTPGLKSHQ